MSKMQSLGAAFLIIGIAGAYVAPTTVEDLAAAAVEREESECNAGDAECKDLHLAQLRAVKKDGQDSENYLHGSEHNLDYLGASEPAPTGWGSGGSSYNGGSSGGSSYNGGSSSWDGNGGSSFNPGSSGGSSYSGGSSSWDGNGGSSFNPGSSGGSGGGGSSFNPGSSGGSSSWGGGGGSSFNPGSSGGSSYNGGSSSWGGNGGSSFNPGSSGGSHYNSGNQVGGSSQWGGSGGSSYNGGSQVGGSSQFDPTPTGRPPYSTTGRPPFNGGSGKPPYDGGNHGGSGKPPHGCGKRATPCRSNNECCSNICNYAYYSWTQTAPPMPYMCTTAPWVPPPKTSLIIIIIIITIIIITIIIIIITIIIIIMMLMMTRNLYTCMMDYTQLPTQLDQRFEQLETGGALRAAILDLSQKALLAQPSEKALAKDDQKKEKEAAFDLLDALTKSGALPLVNASLHVVVSATHCFDKTVTETVIQDNMNPIENVERSALLMAACLLLPSISSQLLHWFVPFGPDILSEACAATVQLSLHGDVLGKMRFASDLLSCIAELGTFENEKRFGEAGLRRMRSPKDWRNEVVYSVMVDRFANGDIMNDLYNIPHYQKQDLKTGEPWNLYQWRHGGDLLGVLGRLSYLKHLGATVVALSPVFLNSGGEYHGYSISDLATIDPGFGDAQLLQTLVAEAHQLGIRVVLDVQVNHAVAAGLEYRSVHVDPVSQVSNCVASFEEAEIRCSVMSSELEHAAIMKRSCAIARYSVRDKPLLTEAPADLVLRRASAEFFARCGPKRDRPNNHDFFNEPHDSEEYEEEHVAPRVNAFRNFMAQVCEQVCIEFEREVTQMSEDILMYRGELARCADLLAFQLGKEKQYHNMLENIADNTTTLIGKSAELGQKHDAHEPLREQMNQIMDIIMNTHKDVHAGHGVAHNDHRQLVESHLLTSAQLQNQAEAVQAELDNIMKVLNVPVVAYTKAPALPSPAAPVKTSSPYMPYSPPQANNPQSPGMSLGSPAGKKPLGASPTRTSPQGRNDGSRNGEPAVSLMLSAGLLWTEFLGDALIEFDTMNPSFQEVSTNLLKYWVAYADIDGLRLSSVDFISADFTAYLSTHLRHYAKKLGKAHFFLIGEVDLADQPFGLQHLGTMAGSHPASLPYQLKRAKEELCPYYAGLQPPTPGLMAAYPTAEVAQLRSVTSSQLPPAEFFQGASFLAAKEVQRDIGSVADVRSAWTAAESYQLPRLLSVTTSDHEELHSWRSVVSLAWSLTWRGIPEIWYGAEFGFTGLCYGNEAERQEILQRMVSAKISPGVAEDVCSSFGDQGT
ncbi:tvaII [Symbiodinium natans]|uniref:TvaII protein n=1 Tax=Symbiodinium natans TaxID=878477 RepID=A0A812PRU9_9DINO|nr:tvaII [Symbiodinium natans]